MKAYRPLLSLIAGMGIALFAVPVMAAQIQPKANAYDAGERVCQKLTVVGSRLAVKKVCMTRGQWEERQREDRDAIDQAQRAAHVGCSTANTHTGAPSC